MTKEELREKADKIIDDICFGAKEFSEKKCFVPVCAAAVLAVAVLIIAIFSITGGTDNGKAAAEFSMPAAAGFEGRIAEMKKSGVSVTLRISDIRKKDGTSTSLTYKSDYAQKYIVADLIITNKSKNDICVYDMFNCGTVLASLKDTSSKYDENDCMSMGDLYDKESGEMIRDKEIIVPKYGTAEVTLCYSFPASRINDINYLLFCEPYSDGVGMKWEVAGIGKPYLAFKLDNEQLFPEIIQGDEPDKTAETVQTTTYISPYPTTKISSDDAALAMFSSDCYELSLEVSGKGDLKNDLSVVHSGYTYSMDGPAIIGSVPEICIDGDSSEIDRIKLFFKIDDSLKENTLGSYALYSDEFKGIKRFNVFMYFEDMNMLMPIETFCDEATNTVWAESDSAGTYALLDMELWLDSLGVSPSEYNE